MVKAMGKYNWTLDFTSRVCDEYRKFLTLCAKHQGMPIVPSLFVDDFWHLHILDTQKYQEDCQEYLGYFLHHFPYFGMRGEDDAKNLAIAGEKTHHLYESAFGTLPADLWYKDGDCTVCRPSPSPTPSCSCGSIIDGKMSPSWFNQRPTLTEMVTA
jgi:hypothetical protein